MKLTCHYCNKDRKSLEICCVSQAKDQAALNFMCEGPLPMEWAFLDPILMTAYKEAVVKEKALQKDYEEKCKAYKGWTTIGELVPDYR